MDEMTYKGFFEKAKTHPETQSIIIQCFVTATKMVVSLNNKNIDVGGLVLTSLSTMTEAFSGIKLIGKDEITAEYMAEVLNEYSIV